MKDDKTLIRVKEIFDYIKALNEELDEIRDKCYHNDYHVNYFSDRPGTTDLAKICDNCRKNLGVPNKIEVDDFLNQEKK